jgi:FecR protein
MTATCLGVAGFVWTDSNALLGGGFQALANTPLTQATVRSAQNKVNVKLGSNDFRPAKIQDRLQPDDRLKTLRNSRAELKFNDGSLARVGELSSFQFLRGTRTFALGNGTYLFMIPPGRGSTQFKTRNATAGVNGSALFIRYIEQTDTLIMGALTNNPKGPMTVTTPDGTVQEVRAGQMVVTEAGQIKGFYEFDLKTFYETSSLAKDLNLQGQLNQPEGDSDLVGVREETVEALATQKLASFKDGIQMPEAFKLPENRTTAGIPATQPPIHSAPGRVPNPDPGLPSDRLPERKDTPPSSGASPTSVPNDAPRRGDVLDSAPTQQPPQPPDPVVQPTPDPGVKPIPDPIVTPPQPSGPVTPIPPDGGIDRPVSDPITPQPVPGTPSPTPPAPVVPSTPVPTPPAPVVPAPAPVVPAPSTPAPVVQQPPAPVPSTPPPIPVLQTPAPAGVGANPSVGNNLPAPAAAPALNPTNNVGVDRVQAIGGGNPSGTAAP